MPESFTDTGDYEDYLQQFKTAALLSGWYSTTHDNRPHYFALRLRANALHFDTTLSAAQKSDFTMLVAFRQHYTTNLDILKARMKAARQQPNQIISGFLCDIRILTCRANRAFPHLIEQIVLTSFIEGLTDSSLRWELRKSKPATANDALALAMGLNSFLVIEKGTPFSSHTKAETSVNMISRDRPEQSNHQIMEYLVRTLTEGIRNSMPKPEQRNNRQRSETPNRESTSRSNSTDSQRGHAVRFENKKTNNYHNNQYRKQNTQNGVRNRSTDRNVDKSPTQTL